MTARIVKNNFTSGELSPRTEGRNEADQYDNAVRQMNNFLIKKQGGAFNRQGTSFISEALDHASRSRMQDFQVNTENAYTLELGNGKARVMKEGSLVYHPSVAISAATQANPAIITANGHGLATDDYFDIFDVSGMEELNGRTYKVVSVGTNLIKASDVAGTLIDSTGFGAYTSGGTVNKHVVFDIPYTSSDLVDLAIEHTGDKMYIAHRDYEPRVLTRVDDLTWTVSIFQTLDGPYFLRNSTAITLDPSAKTGGSVTVTASDDLFAATDVGRQLSITESGQRGWAKITGFTSATEVTVSVGGEFGGLSPSAIWRLGAFSDTTGYPRAITLHEDRLWFGYTDSEQQTFWGSKSDLYDTFSPTEPDLTVLDTNGLRFTLGSGDFDAITWLESGFGLFIGTAGGPYTALGSGGPITPSNISVTKQSGYGSNLLPPELLNGSLIYVSRTGRQIRELVYDFESNGYISNDLSAISEHLFRLGDKAIDTAFQRYPDGHFWYVMASGELICMLFDREQNVVGFNRHNLGGTFEDEILTSGFIVEGRTYRIRNNIGGADFTGVGAPDNDIGTEFVATGIKPIFGSGELAELSPAQVESVSSAPSVGFTEDNLYMSVKRTIGGQTRRHIEYLSDEFNPAHSRDWDAAIYLDSSLTYSGASTDTIGNLWHLEGEKIRVVANNGDDTTYTVENGKITLQDEATNVKAGLSYTSFMELLPLEVVTRRGTSVGGVKRIGEAYVKLENSMAMRHGNRLNNLKTEAFRTTTDFMDNPPPLFTGVKDIITNHESSRDGGYFIVQDKPYPLNILYFSAEVEEDI